MHQFQGTDGTTFTHNGDFSGPITLSEVEFQELSGDPITVSMRDLVEFVGEYIRRQRIEALEKADTSTLLGLPKDD